MPNLYAYVYDELLFGTLIMDGALGDIFWND